MNKQQKLDKLYELLKFFQSKEDKEWQAGAFHNLDNTKHCSMGFIKIEKTVADGIFIEKLCRKYFDEPLYVINDNQIDEFFQETPKERVCAAICKLIELVSKD